jgi:hypothetical protein
MPNSKKLSSVVAILFLSLIISVGLIVDYLIGFEILNLLKQNKITEGLIVFAILMIVLPISLLTLPHLREAIKTS